MENKYILINGECLEEMQKLIDKKIRVPLILCDPPYSTTDLEWDILIDEKKLIPLMYKLLTSNGRIIIFGNSPFYDVFLYNCIKGVRKPDRTTSPYFSFSNEIIWQKTNCSNPLAANKQVLRYHEKIMVLNRCSHFERSQTLETMIYNSYTKTIDEKNTKKQELNPNFARDKVAHMHKTLKHLNVTNEEFETYTKNKIIKQEQGVEIVTTMYKNYPKSIVEYHHDRDNIHPTQKPVALLEHLIKLFSNEGDEILDFTMGSGSTGVACKHINRGFIGIELDNKYFAIAKERIESEQNWQIKKEAIKQESENQINILDLI